MSDEDNQQENAGVIAVVAIAILIAIGTALFMGVGAVRKQAAGSTVGLMASAAVEADVDASAVQPAAVAVADDANSNTAPVGDEAAIKVVDGVVRFYFATGKSAVADGAQEALAEAVAAAKAGKTLVISGYHDSTGSPELNAELAKKRALAVRDILLEQGVAEAAIELKKPEAMPSTTHGSDPEARRVDVVIQ